MTPNALISSILKKTALLVGCLFAVGILQAQNTVTFEVSTDARQVLLNSYFEVTFTLSNANGTDFAPPSFKDFILLAGPNSSSSMQIVNGVVTREMGYGYTLQPTRVGKITIGSASVRAGGKKLTTRPLTIEVVKGTTKNKARAEAQVFVKVEPSKTEAYVGEQVLLDFKLYTTVGVEGYDIPEDPDYEGFYAQELRRFSSNTTQEVIGGKQYATKVLRRIALFPQQTGKMVVDPFRIQLAMVDENDRKGFFFNRNVRPVFFTTEPVEIKVNPLPAGAPDSFCGAVGHFNFQAGIDRKTATTDDALKLTMTISGNGDMKRVQAPPLVLSDSFEVYPPKVIGEKSAEIQGEIVGEKVLEYLVLPKYPGQFSIRPVFTYFNVGSGKYESISSGPFAVTVRPGSGKRQPAQSGSRLPDDIRPIKQQTDLARRGGPFAGSPVFFGLAALPLVAFLGFFFFKKRQQKQASIDPVLLKSRLASREAQKRLSTARQHLLAGNSRFFYDEISKASLGYVCDKLNIPLSQLSKNGVQEKLQSLNVGPSQIDEFLKILQTCEMALFAGMDNASDMQSTYEKTVSVITGMEEELS
ncbi:MAG: protein BatD [Bacteroidetes bacterium]|nr:protein BatD [Bacteroidota bacterium]